MRTATVNGATLREINDIKVKYRPECDDEAIIKEVFYENPYQVEVIPMNGIVLDFGAHIGTFTLRCVKERNCMVYAYEPCSENFTLLEENIKLNKFSDNVKTFKLAVASSTQSRKFYRYPKSLQSARFNCYISNFEGWIEEEVQCTTLKKIFEENRLFHCDFLKIDMEEAEKEVFNLESQPYFQKARRIVLEWHNYDGHVYAELLRRLGFTVELAGTGLPQPRYDPTFARGMLYALK